MVIDHYDAAATYFHASQEPRRGMTTVSCILSPEIIPPMPRLHLLMNKNSPTTTVEPPTLSSNFGPHQPLAWLIPDRIPLGRITLFLGPPESGKTSIAFDLANRLATGRPWPEAQAQPPATCETEFPPDTPAELRSNPTYRELIQSLNAKVAAMSPTPVPKPQPADPPPATCPALILTPFQNTSTAITHRLQQFNPDPINLFYCPDEFFNSPLPSANLPARLRAALTDHPEIKLIIIDPILSLLSFLPKTLLPVFLQELSSLAHTTPIAILATAPAPATFSASTNSPLAQLSSHATAIYQLSFDANQPNQRTMQTIKFPGQPPPTLTIELAACENRYLLAKFIPSIAPTARPGLHDDDPTPSQIDFAVEFLREILTLKPMTARKILDHARDHRIPPKTLYRAKALLGVRSYRLTSELFGPFWVWSITGTPDSSTFNLEN